MHLQLFVPVRRRHNVNINYYIDNIIKSYGTLWGDAWLTDGTTKPAIQKLCSVACSILILLCKQSDRCRFVLKFCKLEIAKSFP